MAAAVDESDVRAGSKTKARSFARPSPFTSPAIIGVYFAPDENRMLAVRYTTSKIGKSLHCSITVCRPGARCGPQYAVERIAGGVREAIDLLVDVDQACKSNPSGAADRPSRV